jgi:YbbR domain-containing protein
VLHNFGLKLLSLALAVGLWVAVARDPMAEVAVDVPIEFHNIPENVEISSETIPRAQIRVRGPQRVVRRLQASDVSVEIELSGMKPGERTFDLTADQIPVHPRVVGSFAPGYTIGQIVADPATVTVSGPQKQVQLIEAAITDPVDASGTLDRATFVRHAYVSDPLVEVMTSNPVRVTVIMEKSNTAVGGR